MHLQTNAPYSAVASFARGQFLVRNEKTPQNVLPFSTLTGKLLTVRCLGVAEVRNRRLQKNESQTLA